MQKKEVFRVISRVSFLIFALLLITAGSLPSWIVGIFHRSNGAFREDVRLIPSWLAGLLPQLSPLNLFSTPFSAHDLGGKAFAWGLVWSFLSLAVLLIAVWKGRFFCRWICPAGSLHSAVSRFSLKKHPFRLRISAYLFWLIFFSSLAGFPLFMFLDPLCQFSRMGIFFEDALVIAALLPCLILPVMLLFSIFQPELWCAFICPLGYLFSLIHKKKSLPFAEKINRDRREIIAGMAIGLPGALLLANFRKVAGERAEKTYPVLPPGAAEPGRFSAACIRCYACINSCPTKILTVKFPYSSDLTRWFQPELDADKGVCAEFCNKCTEVCPTGAILPLTLEEKKYCQIGVAHVIKEACLAWADGEHCMVCAEYCPYVAIDTDNDKKGIPRPVVKPELCRGCGFCQNSCPAVKKGKAIIVRGIPKQTNLKIK
ncbi:MAG: hypothetical protein A2017_10695 [Lentisphaerae bacterium GWF2_44_16]|nr:MAG: hypothetical protein A2017_10695 [Lentisphaerae bacterium GWF2_44_16]